VRLNGERPLGNLTLGDAVDLLERREEQGKDGSRVVEVVKGGASGEKKNDSVVTVLKE